MGPMTGGGWLWAEEFECVMVECVWRGNDRCGMNGCDGGGDGFVYCAIDGRRMCGHYLRDLSGWRSWWSCRRNGVGCQWQPEIRKSCYMTTGFDNNVI